MRTLAAITAAVSALAAATTAQNIPISFNSGNITLRLPGVLPTKSSKAPIGCPVPDPVQKSNGIVCSYAINGLHFLCGLYSYSDAFAACAAHGWRLALVDDENKLDVLNLMNNCQIDPYAGAWIASFNGLRGTRCALAAALGNAGVAFNGFPAEVCGSATAVVCQDIPLVTVTEDFPVTTTTRYRAKTKTVHRRHPTCPGRHISPCAQKNPTSDFVLIDGHLPYKEAECACSQLGLQLADLTIGNFLDASGEAWAQLGPRKHVWIRSWNGDVYERDNCLALWTGASGPGGAIAVPQSCRQRIPVLCQKPAACHCPPSSQQCHCRRHHSHVLLAEQEQQPEEFTLEKAQLGQDKCLRGKCPRVCKHHIGNIRVVKASVGAYEAADVCRQFGWHLLDLTTRNQYKAAALQRTCGPGANSTTNMWIRSFEQVDGAACIFSSPLYYVDEAAKDARAAAGHVPLPAVAGYAYTADFCDEIGGLYVLCETDCRPAETHLGSYSGTVSTTTATSGFTVVVTSYTTTVTVRG